MEPAIRSALNAVGDGRKKCYMCPDETTVRGQKVSEDFEKPARAPRKFRLTHLGNLNQVTKALAKTLRAMSDGSLDTADGARICNGLGIMRMCFETLKLEELEIRMGEISSRVANGRLVNPPYPLSIIDHESDGASH